VDSSESAIQLAERSAELNGVAGRCKFVQQEVEAYMKEAAEAGLQWDIVVLDPPKLAPTRKSLERAAVKCGTHPPAPGRLLGCHAVLCCA
jgi:23S rRNA (cytosine1962-C5)-methyltransferase